MKEGRKSKKKTKRGCEERSSKRKFFLSGIKHLVNKFLSSKSLGTRHVSCALSVAKGVVHCRSQLESSCNYGKCIYF